MVGIIGRGFYWIVGSTAVVIVVILTFPPYKKCIREVVKAKYCLQAEPVPLRIRNLENCECTEGKAETSTGQVTFIDRHGK